jgi:hypothetical protein
MYIIPVCHIKYVVSMLFKYMAASLLNMHEDHVAKMGIVRQ